MADLITGTSNGAAAERAVADLQNLGYSQNNISVMLSDQTRTREFAEKSTAPRPLRARVSVRASAGHWAPLSPP